MHSPIDIDNVENVVGKGARVGEKEGKKRKGNINLYAVNRGEQLWWPLSCPLHLFGNIISTNQGPAKEKWSHLIYTRYPRLCK